MRARHLHHFKTAVIVNDVRDLRATFQFESLKLETLSYFLSNEEEYELSYVILAKDLKDKDACILEAALIRLKVELFGALLLNKHIELRALDG